MMFPSLFLTLCKSLTIYWKHVGDMNDAPDDRPGEPPDDRPSEPPTDTRITR